MPSPEERQQREARRLQRAIFRVRLSQALRRRPVFVWLIAALLAGVGALMAGGESLGLQELSDKLLLHGALIPARVHQGDWWRLLSGTMIHRSWQHLAINLVGLVLIGRHTEAAYGRSGFLCLYLGACLSGAVGTMIAGHTASVGASGAVFGLIGGFITVGVRLWAQLSPQLRRALVGIPVVIVAALLALSFLGEVGESSTDVAAHIGGFLGGLAIAFALPIALKDAELRPLAALHSTHPQRAAWLVATVLSVFAILSIREVAVRAHAAPALDVVPVRSSRLEGVALPDHLPSGVWRKGRCDGVQVDPIWTLSTRRVACFSLPLAGSLLIGRPAQLLTLDRGDRVAMARAWREHRFVWRQPNVLLAPAGRDLLYVVHGHHAMLAAYAEALGGVLPTIRPTGSHWEHALSLPAVATRLDDSPDAGPVTP
ncbi:MAG: rhomboid family intramembrane serine protease [Myxococcales bacterium]|nr:rhomboid family intramembrane serine protease [Myxococcales bacterium]